MDGCGATANYVSIDTGHDDEQRFPTMPGKFQIATRGPEVPDLPEPPDVFSFVDYREWLKAAVHAASEHDRLWTHRRLAALCGLRSSGGLSLVVGGHRRLSESAARRVGVAFGLRPAEVEHLVLCVRYELAESAAAKTAVLRRMRQQRRFVQSWEGTLRTLAFYETWYLPLLRECISLLGAAATPSAIAQRLRPALTETEIGEGLQRLLELELVTEQSDGSLVLRDVVLATNDEVSSTALRLHHEQMIAHASAALDVPAELRNFRVATVTLSHAQARQVHQMVHQFMREVMATVSEDGPLDEVYQMNIQWFPWTRALATPTSDEDQTLSPDAGSARTREPK